jgi:hypothetical protein
VPVEELDVPVEVLVEVATALQRPAGRPDGVDTDSQDEEDGGSEWSASEPLERGEGTREPVSCVRQA